jgi:hypothetical protein
MNRMDTTQDVTRRDFIKGGSVATLMTMLGGIELTARAAEAEAPAAATKVPKTRCAVIGLGSWGREIVSTLSRIERAEIAAVCDTYGASLKRAARSAPGATQVQDYRKILEDETIPAVIVATPTHLHRQIVIEALEAGKAVYCEAPLAHTIDDARAIALAARKATSQHFQSGLQLRADKHRAFVLNFIRSGARGKAVAARAQYHKKQSWRQAAPSPERGARAELAAEPGNLDRYGRGTGDPSTGRFELDPRRVAGGGDRVWVDDACGGTAGNCRTRAIWWSSMGTGFGWCRPALWPTLSRVSTRSITARTGR